MIRKTRVAAVAGVLGLMGTLFMGWSGVLPGGLPAALGATSRPLVWVSAQDVNTVTGIGGEVFVTQGASILRTFDFVHGDASGTPVISSNPKPHLINFSPDGKLAFVTFQGVTATNAAGCLKCVAVIDTSSRTVVATLDIPGGGVPVGNTLAQGVVKTTEAKTSPDGRFLYVSQIGNNGGASPTAVRGTVTRFSLDDSTSPPTINLLNQAVFPSGEGPACFEFSPSTGDVYVDSSLSTFLGMLVIDPVTLAQTAADATIGDPQCGFHDPIQVGGVPTVVMTDSGTPTGGANPNQGHVHFVNTTIPTPTAGNGGFTEPSYSPFFAKNLHDNWPVQLEPAGVITSDPANISYMSDRDSDVLKRVNLDTGALTNLTMTPPDIQTGSGNCAPDTGTPVAFGGTSACGRGAIDTLDGSGDTVFAAMKETGDLAIVDNFSTTPTQTFLHLNDPDPSCAISGNLNFHKCFTVHAVSVQPVHTLGSSLIVGSGQTLVLANKQVNGGIIVNRGGTLIMDNSSATSLSGTGPAGIHVCGSHFSGSVAVNQATGFVLFGDPVDDACNPNFVGGSLTLQNNTAGLDAINNTVQGAVTITGNTPTSNVEFSGNGPG